jgi:hypothetical protein
MKRTIIWKSQRPTDKRDNDKTKQILNFIAGLTKQQIDINYSSNQYLKDHWNKRGLVTINTHFTNPVSVDQGHWNNR